VWARGGDGEEHTAIQCATERARAVRKGQGESETRYTGFFFLSFLLFFCRLAILLLYFRWGHTVCLYIWFILFSVYRDLWFIHKFYTDLELSISDFPHSAVIFTRKNQFTYIDLYTTMYKQTHTRTAALVALKHFVVNFHLSVSDFFLFSRFCFSLVFFRQETKNVLYDRPQRHTFV